MKALVYHGPGKRALEDKPKPTINSPTDAIVKPAISFLLLIGIIVVGYILSAEMTKRMFYRKVRV